jgi:diguanylate cyclase (GGDEF)-like protein
MSYFFSSESEHLRALFEFAPISLWEEDFSGVKTCLDDLRARGVTDLRGHIRAHPGLVQQCMDRIVVLDVNRKTLELFGAASREELLANLPRIFRDDMGLHFTEELVDLWNGKTFYEREGVNYSLNGEPIDIHIQWTVLPGFEGTLGHVLVSINDITARKRAEEYLKYLGTHDVLTGLFNRAYFVEERDRIERDGPYPVSILIADLDSLKVVNDEFGHEEGDNLLRRAAEVLKAAFPEGEVAARVGGDEFAVILPATDESQAKEIIARLRQLIELNNTYYQGPALQTSLGTATGQKGRTLTGIQRQADDRMYTEKREHHNSGDQPSSR